MMDSKFPVLAVLVSRFIEADGYTTSCGLESNDAPSYTA